VKRHRRLPIGEAPERPRCSSALARAHTRVILRLIRASTPEFSRVRGLGLENWLAR
jgi:hypothetical protein